MRLRSAVAAIALGLVAGGCSLTSSAPSLSPEAAFCGSLKDYAVAVVDFQALDDQNTIDEYKAAAQGVADAMQDVAAAAVVMGEASVDELQTATDALVGTVIVPAPGHTGRPGPRGAAGRTRGRRQVTAVHRSSPLQPATVGIARGILIVNGSTSDTTSVSRP